MKRGMLRPGRLFSVDCPTGWNWWAEGRYVRPGSVVTVLGCTQRAYSYWFLLSGPEPRVFVWYAYDLLVLAQLEDSLTLIGGS